jgi:delta24-sterol reductase
MSVIYLSYNHKKKVEELLQKINGALPPFGLKFKGNSNTTRSKDYKKNLPKLDLAKFKEALSIDLENQTITVEPRITFDELVKKTLQFGFIPLVVPEFKGITVGGAIMGAAAESSSFKEGLFSDTCTQYEVLIGKNQIIEVSEEKNKNLFYGIAGSYGSLGVLLSVTLRIKKAKKFVLVKQHAFSDFNQAVEFMDKSKKSSFPYEFIDGVAFSKNDIRVFIGYQNDDSKHLEVYKGNSLSACWFFQYVKNGIKEFSMPTYDYLFRFDRAAFWMGSFLLYPHFLKEYFFNGILRKKNCLPLKKLYPIKAAAMFLRLLLSSILTSKNLWFLLHLAGSWIKDSFVIQDFLIPKNKASFFLDKTVENIGVFPLWLCPIKGSNKQELFNPHYNNPLNSENFYINIGIYGQSKQNAELATRFLEKEAKYLEARKVLYATSYYSEEEFWSIYSKENYQLLRKQTFSDGVWQDIVAKILH